VAQGLLLLMAICSFCLGFVIFVTSKQSYSGLRHHFRGGPPPPPRPSRADRLKGQCCLFGTFFVICTIIMLFFTLVPLQVEFAQTAPRNDEAWRAACDSNDVAALAQFGLS